MSRALIVGGTSRLGQALAAHLREVNVDVLSTARGDPDLPGDGMCIYVDLREDFVLAPEVLTRRIVYIVAAVTGVVACESDPGTWRVNADAPVKIARQARTAGAAHVVFVSSDAVEVAPHTAYAKQKAYAELGVLAQGGSVFRPARMGTLAAYASAARVLATIGLREIPGVRRWAL